MDYSKNITLLKEIRSSLEKLANGSLSDADAVSLLSVYEERHQTIHAAAPKITEEYHTANGFCYQHNVENFSLLSGVFLSHDTDFQCIAFHGDKSPISRITSIIQNQQELPDSRYISITPEDDSRTRTTLHLYPFEYPNGCTFIVFALSSSPYFELNKFLHFSNFIKSLFPMKSLDSYGITPVLDSIRLFVDSHKDNNDFDLFVYTFNDINTIFSHMGYRKLFEISDVIVSLLYENWGKDEPVFRLSLKKYIVISLNTRGNTITRTTGKTDFRYKGIILPYTMQVFRLHESDPFDSFLTQLSIS